MELQFAFEFHGGLRIGILAAEFENGVTEQGVSAGIFRIEVNGLAKFGDGGFRKVAERIRAAEKHVQSGGVSHGVLQVLEPLLGVGEALCFQVCNAEKVGRFKVVVNGDGSLEFANGGGEIAAVEIRSGADILAPGMRRALSADSPGKPAGSLYIS